jgi:transcriptional regulator with XRE-family HTH domain
MTTFLERYTIARRESTLSATDISERSGLSVGELENMTSNPTIGKVKRLAISMAIRPDWLAGWTNDRTHPWHEKE